LAGCCECGDEPSDSGATELVSRLFNSCVPVAMYYYFNITIQSETYNICIPLKMANEEWNRRGWDGMGYHKMG
jgi:hypothetical protein